MNDFFGKRRNVVFVAILYSFLWGSAFPLVKVCMTEFGAADNMAKCLVAGIRFSISGLLIYAYMSIKDKKPMIIEKKHTHTVILYGVFTALQYTFTYIGLSNINASVGAVFDQLCVFFVIIISGIFLKNDKLTLTKVFGCIIGFLGVIAVNTEKMTFTFSFDGEGMMLFAALMQTFGYFVAVFSARRLSAIRLVSIGQFIGGALMIIFSLIMGANLHIITYTGCVVLISLSLISAVAYVLSLMPLKFFPASDIAVFNLLITLFGVVMSGLVLGENVFRINYLISLIFVSMGIFLVNKKA